MSTIKLKSKVVANYAGQSVNQSGVVNVSLKVPFSGLQNTVMLLDMLNADITVKVKLPDEKPMRLGSFKIKSVNVASDGISKLTFTSLNTFVEMGNLAKIVIEEPFQVMFEADVDTDGDMGEEREEE